MRPHLALAVSLLLPACTGGPDAGSSSDNLQALRGIGSIVILSRAPRMGGVGDVFQYTSYVPGAKLLKLSPPTADGKRSTLCCDQYPEMKGLDIQAYDVSFDARSIVFAGRIEGDSHYGLYVLTLSDKGEPAEAPRRLATDANRDYVYPIFAPKDRIVFVTNEVAEAGAQQHRDEYERGTTTQLGSISTQGTDELLGPRNLSHRTAPTMLADGRVLFTQWDHLGSKNEGNLMIVNPDLSTLREGFGKEGKGLTNSYLKAVEIEPYRLVAIGTSRDRTLQAGKLLDLHLGETVDGELLVSEAHSSASDLTPDVPGDRSPSADTVGRYYDAYPVRRLDGKLGAKPLLLVSWANGPVEERTLAAAKVAADFGIYLYDSATKQRLPILNDPDRWEVMAKPLAPRAAPAIIDEAAKNGVSDQAVLVGSLNVNVTSLGALPADRPVRKVRVIEGFSVEEGIPNMFGLTEHEGAARLGDVPVFSDGSWAALIPANVPVHLQPVDSFGMSVRNEPVWFSGRAGESRVCGGCHEDRAKTTVIQPGITMAFASGAPPSLDRPRAQRRSMDFSRDKVVGVPWDLAVQKVLDDHACGSCHDGDPAKPGNHTLTFTDTMMNAQSFTFNLKGDAVNLNVGGEMISGYSASHLSLLGPMIARLEEKGITVTGDLPVYLAPTDAHGSLLFQKLNPREIYAEGAPKLLKPGAPRHPADVGGTALTDDEMYILILMADMGGQFYSRENAPGKSGY